MRAESRSARGRCCVNRSFGLGVIGFVIGGGIICVLEFRPDLIRTLMANKVAEQKDAPGNSDDQSPAASAGDAKPVTSASSTPRQPREDDSRPAATSTEPPPETNTGESAARLARSTSVSAQTNDENTSGADPQHSQPPSDQRSNRPARSDQGPVRRPASRRQASRAVVRDPETQRDFEVRIRRILVGADVAAATVIDEPELRKHERSGRYVVYFDLSVTNRAKSGAPRISHEDFRLEDGKGMIYSPLKPRNPLSGRLAPAETARGGVAFAVYNDSAPARLLIRTGAETFQSLPESIFTPGGD